MQANFRTFFKSLYNSSSRDPVLPSHSVGMNVVQVIQTSKTLKHMEKKNLNLFLREGRKEGWEVILKMDAVLSAARETVIQSPWSFFHKLDG